ncbi:hypothetical protein CDD83_8388 [Cordyceps sp. RAO-2017]|nr:hypothetical protein CDD83_8388 [Cordyceps sp. RAO-2017]
MDIAPDGWTSQNPEWRNQWQRSLVFPATGKNRTTVDADDIPRLDEGQFLNDNIINFYLRYLQCQLEKERPELLEKVYIFSTFFLEKLRLPRGKINYDGVKAWTAKFDLFSYDYIIVPVNEHLHWYLAIICNVPSTLHGISKQTSSAGAQKLHPKQPKILTLDSLGQGRPLTCKNLKDYLAEEAKNKKGADLAMIPNGMTARDIPKQNNHCDCGAFVLGYVEEFLKDPNGVARKLLRKENVEWNIQPSTLRDKVRSLLFKLQGEQQSRLESEKEEKRKSAAMKKVAKQEKTEQPRLEEILDTLPAQALPESGPAQNAGDPPATENRTQKQTEENGLGELLPIPAEISRPSQEQDDDEVTFVKALQNIPERRAFEERDPLRREVDNGGTPDFQESHFT